MRAETLLQPAPHMRERKWKLTFVTSATRSLQENKRLLTQAVVLKDSIKELENNKKTSNLLVFFNFYKKNIFIGGCKAQPHGLKHFGLHLLEKLNYMQHKQPLLERKRLKPFCKHLFFHLKIFPFFPPKRSLTHCFNIVKTWHNKKLWYNMLYGKSVWIW